MYSAVKQSLESSLAFISSHEEEWRPEGKHVWLEIPNHVFRIFIQNGTIAQHKEALDALAALQNNDGGWGEYNDDPVSRTRATAFVSQMLLKADLFEKSNNYTERCKKAIDLLMAIQKDDGSWEDDRWHYLDATSVPTGTLLYAVRQSWAKEAHREALEKSMAFILGSRDASGFWEVTNTRKGSTVEATAHLLQKCVTYGCAEEEISAGISALLDAQEGEGSWDEQNIDATCDVFRCLLYVNSNYPENAFFSRIEDAGEKAMRYLLSQQKNGGFGAVPGAKANVLITCDFTDTAYKYLLYKDEKAKMGTLYS